VIKIGDTEFNTMKELWDVSGLSPEERFEIRIKTKLVGKMIEAREKKGLTQKKLAELTGLKQPFIARIEKGDTDPQLTSVIKILEPLGYTLAVVPKRRRKFMCKDGNTLSPGKQRKHIKVTKVAKT
jgi:transcriptional regulator with XRE-family HTH domain